MTPGVLVATSVITSIAVAGLGLGLGRMAGCSQLSLKAEERMWSGLLIAPLVPFFGVVAAWLSPPAESGTASSVGGEAITSVSVGRVWPLDDLAAPILIFAALAILFRTATLLYRAAQTGRLVARARIESSTSLLAEVAAVGKRFGVRDPEIRVSDTVPSPFVAGFLRPVLLLPAALALDARPAVIAHEMAHLKRGDHRSLWLEEGLLVLLAFNPFLPAIHARKALAREMACDALALESESATTRQAYAHVLLNTWTASSTRLCLASSKRTHAMTRLQSIYRHQSRRGGRVAALVLITCGAVTAGGSMVLAQARVQHSAGIPAQEASTSDQARIEAAAAGLDITVEISPEGLSPAPTPEARAQREAARKDLARLRGESRALRAEFTRTKTEWSAARARPDSTEADDLEARMYSLGDQLTERREHMENIVSRHWPVSE